MPILFVCLLVQSSHRFFHFCVDPLPDARVVKKMLALGAHDLLVVFEFIAADGALVCLPFLLFLLVLLVDDIPQKSPDFCFHNRFGPCLLAKAQNSGTDLHHVPLAGVMVDEDTQSNEHDHDAQPVDRVADE